MGWEWVSCATRGDVQRTVFTAARNRSRKEEGNSKKHKHPSRFGNSVYQFKLNISLLKSEVQPQNTALVKLLACKIKAHAIT